MKIKLIKIIIITLSVLIALAVISFFLIPYLFPEEEVGITSIRANAKKDTAEIKINYSLLSYGKYSVEIMDENEGEFIGDGMRDYDGALGKHRIKVSFGDTELARSYAMKVKRSDGIYDYDDVIELENSPIKIKMRFGSGGDHGVTMYFGFDVPISVEETSGELNELGGTVKIPIKISE